MTIAAYFLIGSVSSAGISDMRKEEAYKKYFQSNWDLLISRQFDNLMQQYNQRHFEESNPLDRTGIHKLLDRVYKRQPDSQEPNKKKIKPFIKMF